MKNSLASLLVAGVLAACGGGSSGPIAVTETYHGVLSGTNCFDFFAQTAQADYAVTRALTEGGAVTLVDAASGITWTGTMTSVDSFRVTSAAADPRMSITVTDITSTSAGVVATTSCVSFRCCTPLAGVVQVTRV